MTRPNKDGFSILGLGAAACVACCAAPILAFLGGAGVAGIASIWLIGSAGLVIAAASAAAFVLVRRRRARPAACAPRSEDRVSVPLTTRNQETYP